MTEVLLHGPIETANQTPPLFEDVYRKHFQIIVGYLYWKSGNFALAEDLAQELFLKLFYKHTNQKGEITVIKEPDKMAAFLKQIACNMLIDHRRIKKNCYADDLGALLELPERVSTDPAKLVIMQEGMRERNEMAKILTTGMQTIKPGFRRVLEASYVEGLSDPEIAQSLEAPLGTIKSRKSRAKSALVGQIFPGGISTYNLPDSLSEVEDYPF